MATQDACVVCEDFIVGSGRLVIVAGRAPILTSPVIWPNLQVVGRTLAVPAPLLCRAEEQYVVVIVVACAAVIVVNRIRTRARTGHDEIPLDNIVCYLIDGSARSSGPWVYCQIWLSIPAVDRTTSMQEMLCTAGVRCIAVYHC